MAFPGVRFRLPADTAGAADTIGQLTEALAKQLYRPLSNFLERFGGAPRKGMELTQQPQSAMKNMLHAIPGAGPMDASAVAQEYSSIGALLSRYTKIHRWAGEHLRSRITL